MIRMKNSSGDEVMIAPKQVAALETAPGRATDDPAQTIVHLMGGGMVQVQGTVPQVFTVLFPHG